MVISKAPDLDEFKELYDKQLASVDDLFVKATFYDVYYIDHREDKDSLVDKWYYKILNRESIKRFNKPFFEVVPELKDFFYSRNVVHSVLYEGLTEKGLKKELKKRRSYGRKVGDWKRNSKQIYRLGFFFLCFVIY